nr:Amino acid transporter domain containing protein [Haemonchus contortus]
MDHFKVVLDDPEIRVTDRVTFWKQHGQFRKQLLTAKHVINEIPWFTSAQGVIMATGAVIYSFEGQALVLPLTNKMEHPSEMRGWTGVLTTGIVLVTTVYAGCGFYGYITYGENVKESITLNMDQSP